MSDSVFDQTNKPIFGNIPEFSVSELSHALKTTVENAFARVRVRAEISDFKQAKSGHLYMTLRDEAAVIDAVCWRGIAQRLDLDPADGMDVIATGQLTIYAGRSKYQLIIERLELAGVGALLKLLEDRKKKLATEGLFDQSTKKKRPFLPDRIGVVTSPTGAVIRDILHRLQDRFPRPVLVWPVAVQGPQAAAEIANAIQGFNRLALTGTPPLRPDLLIVARGGGSLEDLWAFNEEIVVRAAAASTIPLISAVGHETDTTLIDFAADERAPTPTAAAELAVPVRAELLASLGEHDYRLTQALFGKMRHASQYLAGLAHGLPKPQTLLDQAHLRLDDWGMRLQPALVRSIGDKQQQTDMLGQRLRPPNIFLDQQAMRLDALKTRKLQAILTRIKLVTQSFSQQDLQQRLHHTIQNFFKTQTTRLDQVGLRMESVSYRATLKRGYAVVRDHTNNVISTAKQAQKQPPATIELYDGRLNIAQSETSQINPSKVNPSKAGIDELIPKKRRAQKSTQKETHAQGRLL